MSDFSLEGLRINQLQDFWPPLLEDQTLFEVEQENLLGDKSRKVRYADLLNDLLDKIIEDLQFETESAQNINYNNTQSGLQSENIQDAIDELVDIKARISDLAQSAFTGDYEDLDNKPTLGTAAERNVGTDSNEIPLNGTLNLHPVSSTGNYEDLTNRPNLNEYLKEEQVSSAAFKDAGTDPNELPTNEDVVNYLESENYVKENDLANSAFVETGKELNQIPKNEDLLLLEKEVVGDYTLQVEDMNQIVSMNNTTERSLFVPAHESIEIPIGAVINIFCEGPGEVLIKESSGVIVRNKGYISQYNEASLRKRKENEWIAYGTIGEL